MKTFKLLSSLFSLSLFFLLQYFPLCYAQSAKDNYWVTYSDVTCIARQGSITYIGGFFTYVGPYTGGFVRLDKSTGKFDPSFIKVDGSLLSAAPDNSGGWYICSHFVSVNGTKRNDIAHVLSNGEVDLNWDPAPDYYVQSLAVSGNIVYALGNFTSIGGQSRNNIAALDENGRATPFNPNPDGQVAGITVADSLIYVYGSFNNIGGKPRRYLAALYKNGSVSSWNPHPDNTAFTLTSSGNNIYAGGPFNSVNGVTRNYIAVLGKNGQALD